MERPLNILLLITITIILLLKCFSSLHFSARGGGGRSSIRPLCHEPSCPHLHLLVLLVLSARPPWSVTTSFIHQQDEDHHPRSLRMEKSRLDVLPHPGQMRNNSSGDDPPNPKILRPSSSRRHKSPQNSSSTPQNWSLLPP